LFPIPTPFHANSFHLPDELKLAIYRSTFVPAQRYASAGTNYGPLSVCLSALPVSVRKSVFYRNGWTDRAGFWPEGFFRTAKYAVL